MESCLEASHTQEVEVLELQPSTEDEIASGNDNTQSIDLASASETKDTVTTSTSASALIELRKKPMVVFNMKFSCRLNTMNKFTKEVSYQLACLSTLGGAYHLINDPNKAFMIAVKTEWIGRLIGSSELLVKANVYKAVNLGLKGGKRECKKLLKQCRRYASPYINSNMVEFIDRSESWLRINNFI